MNNNKPFKGFLIVWSGQLLSSIGNGLTAFALGIFVFNLTGSAVSYSMIILASFLPALLLKPFGGVLSDRFDRRIMMITGDLGSALGLSFILVGMLAGFNQMRVIYVGIIFSSIFSALQNPAYKSTVTDLLDKESFSKASGLMQLSESAKFIISPIIAGFLMNIMDIKWVLLIDMLSYIIAALTVLKVRKNITHSETVFETVPAHLIEELSCGLNYILSRKGLMPLLLITSLFAFFIGFLQSLLGPMILVFESAETLGMITTVSATGMILSSLFIGLFSKTEKKLPILSISLFFAGIFYALLGVSTNVPFIISSGFLFFMALPFVNTSLDVLVRKNVDNQMQGRVWSIVSLISQSGMIIAFSTAGFLADKIFNPLLMENGFLALSIGQLTGIGPGRGIGVMFILSGVLVSTIAVIIGNMKVLRALDDNDNNQIVNTEEVTI